MTTIINGIMLIKFYQFSMELWRMRCFSGADFTVDENADIPKPEEDRITQLEKEKHLHDQLKVSNYVPSCLPDKRTLFFCFYLSLFERRNAMSYLMFSETE